MKKLLYLVIILLVFGLSINAEEALLIDFSLLTPDFPADSPTLNERTIMDYSTLAGRGYTAEQRQEMKSSLALEEWTVTLNSSAKSMLADSVSNVRAAQVNPESDLYSGETVLGFRTLFPSEPYNAFITITPPFEILPTADRDELQVDGSLIVPEEEIGGSRKFVSFGVLQNVGSLRSMSVSTYGLNYPHRMTILIEDNDRVVHEIPFGNLEFSGWGEVSWENPNYIEDVRKRELRIRPTYPTGLSYIRLLGIRIYRNGDQIGGDYVGYVKDIKVTYDRANQQLEEDINSEAIWGIQQQRADEQRFNSLERFGREQVLQYIERLNQHVVQDIDGIE